jgi:hypothetical protein
VTDAMLSGGSLTINDEASGNTISAAGDTSASTGKTLTYNAGSGTDSFTGGFENDKVNVSAAAVGSDTLTGGSGTNTLTLTSAGSANLGGVSKFPTINLAAGNSTVTVTDTTLSGGTVNDQRRRERQQQRERSGRHDREQKQGAHSITPGRGRTASPAGSRTTRSTCRRRRWAATR